MRERKQVRLRDYDYSKSGYYFITICTKKREGWGVSTDEFSVMPNHLHGSLIIEEEMVGNAYMRSHQRNAFMHSLQDKTKMLLSKIIQQHKSSVTRKINSMQIDFKFEWQKSFYDHIIRNEKSLGNIREYIQTNPLKWDLDRENPLSKNFNLDHNHYWKEIYNSLQMEE